MTTSRTAEHFFLSRFLAAAVPLRSAPAPMRATFPKPARKRTEEYGTGNKRPGIPSFAATGTAFLRCDDYHETSDTAEKLDYSQFAEVVQGLSKLVISLANKP